MRAVALGADRRLEVVERADPEPGPGEVVVAVERCGICGSDLHLKASGFLPAGTVLGHEFAGTIAALGPGLGASTGGTGMARLSVGERVAVLPSQRCGACPPCRAGRSNLCTAQHRTVIGLGVNDGGFAEYVRVPASSCHVLPSGMSPEHGALVEPYAVAIHALARSRVAAGAELAVAVLGAGPIGLTTVAALRDAGVQRLAVAEPNAGRGAVAAAMGAAVVDTGQRLSRAMGCAPDVVFDTTGRAETAPLAVEVVAPGGQVVLLGVIGPTERLAMPGLLWLLKEVDVVAAIAYTDDEFATAVTAVAAGAADAVHDASETRPLQDAERSFQELSGPDAPAKVLLAPRP